MVEKPSKPSKHAFCIHDIVFDINDSNRMYCATDGGVYRVGMVQILWKWSNIPVSQFYHVSIDDKEPFNVYGGLQDNGSWYGLQKSGRNRI
jgi:hypothetical protein